jgi:membrane protein DedA with SNARE-associated domain
VTRWEVSRVNLSHLIASYGYWVLFLLIAAESLGVPLPGETALITAGVLAAQGHYSIVSVIVVAAAGAIVGDNVGYWIGRKGGRALLERTPYIRDYFARVLPPSERFFNRHGAKAVFFGRFVSILRVTAAWLAGITHMPWWRFLFWNAAGGILWATAFGLIAYFAGRAVAEAINRYGLYAGIGLVVLIVLAIPVVHRWRKRMLRDNPS